MMMAAVQEELKDFAKQLSGTIANKFAEHETLIENLVRAMEALDARLTSLEAPADNTRALTDPGREL